MTTPSRINSMVCDEARPEILSSSIVLEVSADGTTWLAFSNPEQDSTFPMNKTDPILEVDRAYENLQKSGKGYGMGGRREFSILRY